MDAERKATIQAMRKKEEKNFRAPFYPSLCHRLKVRTGKYLLFPSSLTFCLSYLIPHADTRTESNYTDSVKDSCLFYLAFFKVRLKAVIPTMHFYQKLVSVLVVFQQNRC